jgi:hypothetical protein
MSRTLLTGGDDGSRGQTTQDFAIGISLFLLTSLFVFVFVPGLFTTYEADVSPGSQQQADRIAASMIENYSLEDRNNWLDSNFADVVGYTGSPAGVGQFQERYGTEDFRLINVTLRRADGDSISSVDGAGTQYDGQNAATITRLVVVPSINQCSPGGAEQVCRLIVRIW